MNDRLLLFSLKYRHKSQPSPCIASACCPCYADTTLWATPRPQLHDIIGCPDPLHNQARAHPLTGSVTLIPSLFAPLGRLQRQCSGANSTDHVRIPLPSAPRLSISAGHQMLNVPSKRTTACLICPTRQLLRCATINMSPCRGRSSRRIHLYWTPVVAKRPYSITVILSIPNQNHHALRVPQNTPASKHQRV